MKIEKTEVFGFKAAIRGMRNSYDSWDKSDSLFDKEGQKALPQEKCLQTWDMAAIYTPEYPFLGPNDIKLACKLIAAGPEQAKFLRQIIIWADLTLPRYIWTELDTYKIATVRNSCGTMHTLGKRPLELDDFEDGEDNQGILAPIVQELNRLAEQYSNVKDFRFRRLMKQILPESFLQKATYMMSYQTALSMLHQRHAHNLREWKITEEGSICNWLVGLPYMRKFWEALRSSK